MSTTPAAKKTAAKKSSSKGKGRAGAVTAPKFIRDDIARLFSRMTTPETGVNLGLPARATPTSVQNKIDPPQQAWDWANQGERNLTAVSPADLTKFGLQHDINTLFQLVSVSPAVKWLAVQNFSKSSWTWANEIARNVQKVTPHDLGKVGLQVDINTYYLLTSASPSVWQPVADPTATSLPMELSTGASDAESFHDFFRLQIAFEDVWAEMFDNRIDALGQRLYATWDALAQVYPEALVRAYDPHKNIAGVDELLTFINDLKTVLGLPGDPAPTTSTGAIVSELTALQDAVKRTLQGCNMLLTELNRAGSNAAPAWLSGNTWLQSTAGQNDNPNQPDDLEFFPGVARGEVFHWILGQLTWTPPASTGGTQAAGGITLANLTSLLTTLDAMLKERYRFDVFAPGSINYGVLLNYRQHWQPQSYQVGDLVKTIPLAPQETRRYTTKSVVKTSRNVKEIDAGLRSTKDETSDTSRVDAEIVDRAKNQTNFQTNAHGSFGNNNLYKVEGGVQAGTDQGVESAQTKRDFHEAVMKAAQEYRNEHRTEVTTDESRESESTSYQELRNPNDELTVTYLLYELQRRYIVDESLYKAVPIVLVANEVPAPHEIDPAWLLRHDWIIKRTILDDSFLPALEYLAANYTGELVTLDTLEMAVQHQKGVVDKISQQVLLANQAVSSATAGLADAQSQDINDQKTGEIVAMIKSVFDPAGIFQGQQKFNDGNSDRARIDYAKDALNRAQTKVDQLTSNLKTELTALQIAIDKYTTAATRHFGMMAEIDRLRLHVKDNIIHYMQAVWTYEPPDQRFFRLYNLDVPVFTHHTTVTVSHPSALTSMNVQGPDAAHTLLYPPPALENDLMKLHQIADLDTLIGFKGNYMMFPLVNFDNYIAWYLMQNYLHVDPINGVTARDPDPYADLTLQDLQTALGAIRKGVWASFSKNEPAFEEAMVRLLSDETQRMVIVPSNSLYIEALPGTHPLLEDFKLAHRALDLQKTQAEVRKAELENLRLASRLETGAFGDPDIDKVVVVGNGRAVTVDAG